MKCLERGGNLPPLVVCESDRVEVFGQALLVREVVRIFVDQFLLDGSGFFMDGQALVRLFLLGKRDADFGVTVGQAGLVTRLGRVLCS